MTLCALVLAATATLQWPKREGTLAAGAGVAGVAAGEHHTCAVTAAGAVKCWGYNYFGQLGNGTTTDSSTPVDVTGLNSGVVAVAAGDNHSCAITAAGGLKCWGKNSLGQLGNGAAVDTSLTPVDVSGLTSGVASVVAGNYHTCAVTTAGGLTCWGRNSLGELGNGTGTNSSTPVGVTGLSSGVAAVSAGEHHTCAVTTAGGLTCWGSNAYGALGNGTTTDSTTPISVPALSSGVAGVAAGEHHTCAVMTAGGLTCWGNNSLGQLGNGTTTDSTAPVNVSGLTSGVAAVATGDFHTCALRTAGGLTCWGHNAFGGLGDGGTEDSSIPVDVSGLSSGVSAVTAGGYHTCALTPAGGLKCWGYNLSGELGNGTTMSSSIPVDSMEGQLKDFPGFIFPMGCEINVDCYYVYYIDHDSSGGGLEDFMCGTETYDGHSGTDIILPSFREMDAGVDVYAAAAGTVIEAKDGHFDRNKFITVPDYFVPVNYVMIEHSGGLRSIYLHLRRDSVLVRPGDAVEEGEKIGEVGSSGSSRHPHLHFGVFDADGYTIDPWAGPCGGAESLWREQDPYEDYFILIESYLTLFPVLPAHDPDSIDRLRGSDPILCFSIVALSIHSGDESEFRFVGPGDVPSFVIHHDANQRTPYYGSCKGGGEFRPNPGQWQMQYWLNGNLMASRDFEVSLLAGDATCDGRVDSIDAAIVLQYTAALVGSLACPAGDVNDDGRSDAADAAIILQYVAGLIPPLV